MRKLIILTLGALGFTACNQSEIIPTDIKGTWYLNQWKAYHTLVFTDSTVFIDNNVDTIFTNYYSIVSDTLVTWSKESGETYKNRIIKLSKDTLSLDGLQGKTGRNNYSRIKK